MIVVTGSCRTGTSLMMQTLKLLGVDIVGYAFHDDFPNKKLNPKGYWELPINETINGVRNESYKGNGVKLFGWQLYNTNPDIVKKVIVCKREIENAIESSLKLFGNDIRLKDECVNREFATLVYETNYDFIDKFIYENKKEFITVDYNMFIEKPNEIVALIGAFLGLEFNEEAVKNVNREKVWQ